MSMRLIAKSLMLVFFILLFGIYPAFAEDGTKCKCISHPAEAEAIGTCSRTEDKEYCTLVFSTTTPSEYESFVKQLQSFHLGIDPREALQIAYNKPPEKLTNEELRDLLPVLFAISQRTHFQDLTPRIAELFMDKKDFFYSDKNPFGFFRERGKSVLNTAVGEFEVKISYGCMELKRGEISTMVKTRWSEAKFYCDDFPK